MSTQPNGSPTAIDWPKVTVGMAHLTVKNSFSVIYRLSKAGVDFKSPAKTIYVTLEIFSAMVADAFIAAGQPVPTADFWADQISLLPDPGSKFKEIGEAVKLAQEKAPLVLQPPAVPAKTEASGETTPQTN